MAARQDRLAEVVPALGGAMPTRCWAMAACRPTSRATSLPIISYTIPISPCRRWEGTTAARRTSCRGGPYDQRDVEMRADVLCYTSEPMESDLEVTGPIKVVLYAATDGLDTDWTAKLVDVSTGGYAKNLCDGIIRARYRGGFTSAKLLDPNWLYKYEIDLAVTGNVFKKGHRIRVEVSSSNFPRFDRNHNTGNDLGTDTEMRTAQQTVQHSRAYPSHILLPVIPAG